MCQGERTRSFRLPGATMLAESERVGRRDKFQAGARREPQQARERPPHCCRCIRVQSSRWERAPRDRHFVWRFISCQTRGWISFSRPCLAALSVDLSFYPSPLTRPLANPTPEPSIPAPPRPFERAAGDAQLRGPGEGDLQYPETLARTLGPHPRPQSRLLAYLRDLHATKHQSTGLQPKRVREVVAGTKIADLCSRGTVAPNSTRGGASKSSRIVLVLAPSSSLFPPQVEPPKGCRAGALACDF